MKYGIIAALMLKIYKKLFEILIGKTFENLSVDRKVYLINETLLNIFRNYIPNKKSIQLLSASIKI